jgi:hypothetical protein
MATFGKLAMITNQILRKLLLGYKVSVYKVIEAIKLEDIYILLKLLFLF